MQRIHEILALAHRRVGEDVTGVRQSEGVTQNGAPSNRRPMPVLEVADVSVRYGGVAAVSGVTFSLHSGERCGLLGPNGAGKTSLLDAISGLTSVNGGKVLLLGREVTRSNSCDLARAGLRRTFQRHQPFGWLSVADNLIVALEWRHRSKSIVADLVAWPSRKRRYCQHRERVDYVLGQCGLADQRDVLAATLPIGKIRLLELARAVVDEPKVLLLDEPTSGLATHDAEVLGEVITRLALETSCAFLLVEHDIDFVLRRTDRVMVLVGGQLIADGSPAAIAEDRNVIEAYLGPRAKHVGGGLA